MISKLKEFAGRLPLVVLLATLIVPLANLLSPDRPAGRVKEAAALESSVQDHLDKEAKKYGIPAPIYRYVDSRVPAWTARSEDPADDGKVLIRAGRPLLQDHYQANPEWIKATAGHELGHAVMIARGAALSPFWIFLMYAVGFIPMLIIFPSRPARLIAALSIASAMTLFVITNSKASIQDAYLSLIVILALVGIASGLTNMGNPGDRFAKHLPSRREVLFSFSIAPILFGIAMAIIGNENNVYELRADVFGACSTSSQSMRDALLGLEKKGPSSKKSLNGFLDRFHPGMDERVAVLSELDDPKIYSVTCEALLNGTSPIRLAGLRIQ